MTGTPKPQPLAARIVDDDGSKGDGGTVLTRPPHVPTSGSLCRCYCRRREPPPPPTLNNGDGDGGAPYPHSLEPCSPLTAMKVTGHGELLSH